MAGYTRPKKVDLTRLRRIEGQVRGIQRMIDEDHRCIDILTQVSASTRALQSFSLGMLDAHLAGVVVDSAQKGGHKAQPKIREASDALARLVKS